MRPSPPANFAADRFGRADFAAWPFDRVRSATPGVILVASFLFGTTLAFGMPVCQAIVPDLATRHELSPLSRSMERSE